MMHPKNSCLNCIKKNIPIGIKSLLHNKRNCRAHDDNEIHKKTTYFSKSTVNNVPDY